MPVSASLGPYGAQTPGSTGGLRVDVDEEEVTSERRCFSINVELIFYMNKDPKKDINTFQRL
jgi:hypothetical protein